MVVFRRQNTVKISGSNSIETESVCLTTFTLKLCLLPQPKVVTDTDETELARQSERLERENAEVDGDDDAEENGSQS